MLLKICVCGLYAAISVIDCRTVTFNKKLYDFESSSSTDFEVDNFIAENPSLAVSKDESQARNVCYVMAENSVLFNSAPFHWAVGQTANVCAKMCLSMASGTTPACRGFQYDRYRFLCHFFSTVRNDAGRWPAYGYDYYAMTPDCVTTTVTTVKTTTKSASSTTSTTPPSIQNICPDGTQALIQKSENQKLSTKDSTVIKDVSQEQCIKACVEDKDENDGQYLCISGSYDKAGRVCTLSASAPPPTGKAKLVQQTGSLFFEKTCIPDALAKLCPSLMVERFPQRTLVGFNEMIITASDYQMCIELCIDSEMQFGFRCKSLMFFHSETNDKENCVLNFEDHLSEPDLFIIEPTQRVDYVSINNCQPRISIKKKLADPPILIIQQVKKVSISPTIITRLQTAAGQPQVTRTFTR